MFSFKFCIFFKNEGTSNLENPVSILTSNLCHVEHSQIPFKYLCFFFQNVCTASHQLEDKYGARTIPTTMITIWTVAT